MEKLLEFKNVRISLNEKVLFPEINFVIYKGDKYIFLGKNGSGKSLLLELIFGGYAPGLRGRYSGLKVEGEITDAEGNDLLNPKTKPKISYVTQSEEFHKNATFLDAGKTACNGMGIEFDEKRFDTLLERFGLLAKKNEKIKKNASCGEAKIIHLITRILQLDATNILLLDEPLNHLSFQNSKVFNDIIEEIASARPDLTIIMISHCRAVNFAEKVMQYNYETQVMEIKPYKPYNCFDLEECTSC